LDVLPGVVAPRGSAGNETARDQRRPGAHVIILSDGIRNNDVDAGDKFSDETSADPAHGDNAQAVMTAAIDTDAISDDLVSAAGDGSGLAMAAGTCSRGR
jgi:hypothetical protein